MTADDNVLTFTAIRGIQAGREYYSAMCELKVIAKMFIFDDEAMSPELRAQRTLNKTRIPEMAKYLVDNHRDYTFSSLTASIDGKARFEPYGEEGTSQNLGRLLIPMTSRFLINDGQHRRAAIEEALKERPELGDETLSVVFFLDAGLKRSQQMFADLNRHAIRPNKSIGILYDHRDQLSRLAREVAEDVSFFRNLTDLEKTSISNRSNKLFTLNAIFSSTNTLLGKRPNDDVSGKEQALAVEFWEEVGKNIPDWQMAVDKKVSCADLRKDCIHSHGIALQAIGNAGAALLAEEPKRWKAKLKNLNKLDWARSNKKFWEGRALMKGRVSKALVNVTLTTNAIKKCLTLTLSAREKEAEANFRKK
ncbi:DNA sulfur modification protein DndB [bacterium]|nr:DNA sulfur modification protein DndB [bacterium]